MRRKPRPHVLILIAIAGLAAACVAADQKETHIGDSAGSTDNSARRPPLVVVTDIGVEIDDQWALVHLLLSPELDVRAIITTHASSAQLSPVTSHKKALEVLDRVWHRPSRRPTVVEGADAPLKDMTASQPSAGVNLLLHVSKQSSPSQRLVVLLTGAATEVASAILQDPSIVHRITVVAMGFEDWASGDEFNVRNDPAAWRVVLRSEVPLVIGSAALTKRDLRLTRGEASALVSGRGRVGQYLYGLFDDWVTRQASLVARVVAPETWVIWDEVVVAHVLEMTSGEDRPRPQLEADLSLAYMGTSQRIMWLTNIDHERLWRDFTRKLDALR